ncbi:MAG: adenine phosphoribosyltransferase [Microbacteriaceae bacterium]|jgi:adenine phosphoribosyltransferase|nr:adenine phosphoribosyltransferase [Microbacteriaceae bacterium]
MTTAPTETPLATAARDALERLTLLTPGYPTPGVLFRDLTPVFADAAAFHTLVDAMLEPFQNEFDLVAGIEARGFLLAAAASYATGTGMLTIRKAGKLPGTVLSESYALEYATATIQVHPEGIAGRRVLLMDDLVATGGTLAAAARLVSAAGGTVAGMSVAVELAQVLDSASLPEVPLSAVQVVED